MLEVSALLLPLADHLTSRIVAEPGKNMIGG